MIIDFSIDSFDFVVSREPDREWKIESLSHSELWVIAYAIEGKAHYRVGDEAFTVSQGDMVCFAPGCLHDAWSDPEDPWRFSSVGFSLKGMNEESAAYLAGIPHFFRLPNPFQVAALMEELSHEWSGKRLAYTLRCRSIVEEILFSMIRSLDQEVQQKSVPHVHAIQEICRLIENRPEKSWAVSDLSGRAGLSAPYFRRLFKQVTDLTPVQYQHWVKINKAKDLLLSGECNVSEAADQLGFENVYYFSRLFKRVAHVNPSEFLRR
ncbi:AraC family transcriptional regulator [Oceanispirochaeta sp.]|uniref:AraC family transcriptional regulator n=1 Tax=Oceanispirochaeta sp. TaxID=2035350 RepID=UPI00345C8FF7